MSVRRRMSAGGYTIVFAPEHPLAEKSGWVKEHRKVAWDAGLITRRDQRVTHKNGIADDNRLNNLMVSEQKPKPLCQSCKKSRTASQTGLCGICRKAEQVRRSEKAAAELARMKPDPELIREIDNMSVGMVHVYMYPHFRKEVSRIVRVREEKAVERFVTDMHGERCVNSHTGNRTGLLGRFGRPTACATCQQWERYDQWVAERGSAA